MVKDLSATIGRKGQLHTAEGLHVGVVVTDVRHAYGRTDYQIKPVIGTGSAWVTAARVRLAVAK